MSSVRRIVVASLFIAISVVVGKALETVPNVELISFSVWMSAYVLDRKYSTVVGVISFTVFSLLSPYGAAPLPLLVAQAIGGGLIGFLGGWFVKGSKVDLSKSTFPFHIIMKYLVFGVLITFVYDVLTNIGGFVSFAENSSTLLLYLIGGLSFALVHIISNGIIFMILTPLMQRTLDQIHYLKRN